MGSRSRAPYKPRHTAPAVAPAATTHGETSGRSAVSTILDLQRTAGNTAVSSVLVQRDLLSGLMESVGSLGSSLLSGIAGVPAWALTMLGGKTVDQFAIQTLHKAGLSEGDLTDLIFQLTHPEAVGRKLGPKDKALKAEWKRIRKEVVRPAIRAAKVNNLDKVVDAPIKASELGAFGSEAPTKFREAVYAKQLANAEANGESDERKAFSGGVPPDDLKVLEGGHKLHKDVVEDGKALLAAARADLAAQKAEGKEEAKTCASIGVKSAYRSVGRDMLAWKKVFANYYAKTESDRSGLEGGAFGAEAVKLMVSKMTTYKAVPGFSNHGKGIAIDFSTTDKGNTLGASAGDNPEWRKSWFHAWLEEHAATYNFHPYEKEAWHWDHPPP